MLFFDQNDLFTQRQRQKNLNKISDNIGFLNGEVEKMEVQLKELNSNPLTLERYAREKYFQKRDNEDIYIIKEDSLIEQNKQ